MATFVNISNPSYSLLGSLTQDEYVQESFLDTKIICQNGEIIMFPKFMIGIAFPELETIYHFNVFATNTILLPDYTEKELKSLLVLSRLEVTQTTKQQYEKDYPEEYKEQNEPFLKEEILSEIKSTNTSALKEGKTKKYYKGIVYPGEYPFKCSFCDKKFKQVGHVNHHERTHTGNFKHSCSFCDKKFYQKSHLKEHENIHSGEKPHECQQCQKRFAFSSGLKAHLKIHTGEKHHQCTVCHKYFGQASNLKTHMKLHTGEVKFMCSECGKPCNSKVQLEKHRCKLPIELPLKNLPESYNYITCHEEPVIEQTVYVNDNNELLMKTGNS